MKSRNINKIIAQSIPQEVKPELVEEVKEIKVEEVLRKVTANTNVFYRKDPSTASEALGIIESGREVEVIEENDNWYKIKGFGWSMKRFYN